MSDHARSSPAFSLNTKTPLLDDLWHPSMSSLVPTGGAVAPTASRQEVEKIIVPEPEVVAMFETMSISSKSAAAIKSSPSLIAAEKEKAIVMWSWDAIGDVEGNGRSTKKPFARLSKGEKAPPQALLPPNSSPALTQLRSLLPHGDVGKIINSYIFSGHPTAEKWQRDFRLSLEDNIVLPPVFIPDIRFGFETSAVTFKIGPESSEGWGMLTMCHHCQRPCMVHICHEEYRLGQWNIEHASSWYGDIPCAFDVEVKSCDCPPNPEEDE
mmetsp:Transcript_20464/g.40935  ORF Transcript_20464/g.40935 Transcript_20464/m.40935 type:complete len:268 (-) Transcript_20464:19-822(-)